MVYRIPETGVAAYAPAAVPGKPWPLFTARNCWWDCKRPDSAGLNLGQPCLWRKEERLSLKLGFSKGSPGGTTNLRPLESDEVLWLKGTIKSRLLGGYSATIPCANSQSILSLLPTDSGGLLSCLYLTESTDAANNTLAGLLGRIAGEHV